MALDPGTKLGGFEITGLLGKGGMGEVYAARDRKLGRDVAIKILPEYFAADAERLARFEREAQTLAALNHPNIATVYGFEHDEGRGLHYLVMEHIDGDTLGERIEAGPLSVSALLPIFIDIARGLDAAHEAGIVHRDLKPDNVKLNASGVVKILDFGLAKGNIQTGPTTPDAPTTPIRPLAVTAEGTFLGTPSYMSPEQARGKDVDRRTDIWAFGCCLYQALTGDIPFKGDTIADTVGAILERNPNWSKLPEDVPESVQSVLRRCLEKEPRRRLSSAGDIAITLEEVREGLKRGPALLGAGAATKSKARVYAWVAVAALCVGIGLLIWRSLSSSPTESVTESAAGIQQAVPKPVRRFAMKLPSHLPLAEPQVAGTPLTLSPDGSMLAYRSRPASGGQALVLQRIGELDAQVLFKSSLVDRPSFSPDGQWIAFLGIENGKGKLMKVSISGGPPISLAELPLNFPWPAWTDDGYIVYGLNFGEGLMRVPVTGGEPEVVTTVENEQSSHAFPVVLPGGNGIVFDSFTQPTIEGSTVTVLDLRTHETRRLVDHACPMYYLPTGHLIYVQVGRMMAAPFDVNTLTFTGPAFDVTDEGQFDPAQAPTRVAMSASGTIAYVPSEQSATDALALVSRDLEGKRTPLDLPPDYFNRSFRISPDGRSLAIGIRQGNNHDLWIIDLERGTKTRFTDSPSRDGWPLWTQDGSSIVFTSDRGGRWGLYMKSVDGGTPAEELLQSPDAGMYPAWILPDNSELVFERAGDIYLLQLDESKTIRPLVNTRFSEENPAVSPDGKWMAYQSNESGRAEVYVRSFPDMGSRIQVTTNGGNVPHWVPGTNRLRFVQGESPEQVFEVEIQSDPKVTVGKPALMLTIDRPIFGGAITPDGQRYLLSETLGDTTLRIGGTEVVIVENWFEELKRRATVSEGK